MTTTFDAYTFARAWLSVGLAASSSKDRPALYKTTSIEHYPEGVRLIATDSYVLLTSWAACEGHEWDPEPPLDEPPVHRAIVMDPHGRARGFLGHLVKLALTAARAEGGEAEPGGQLEVRLSLDVAGDSTATPALDGLAARWVVLEHPGNERLRLQSYEGTYPDWRTLYTGITPKSTKAVALNPELLGRIYKLGRYHQNKPIVWGFTGAMKAATIRVDEAHPRVDGIVMPMVVAETRAEDKADRATAGADAVADGVDDELADQAAHWVIKHQQASRAALKLHFKLGHAAASRVIDQLEARGVLSGPDAKGARKVLVTVDGEGAE